MNEREKKWQIIEKIGREREISDKLI